MRHIQRESVLSISKFVDELTANINALNLSLIHIYSQKTATLTEG